MEHRQHTFFFALAALGATSGCGGPAPVPSPPPNPSIAVTTGPLTLPMTVECDGPADEVALLDGICGAETGSLGLRRTTGGGFQVYVGHHGGPYLVIYADPQGEGDTLAEQLRYAAFVQWEVDAHGRPASWRTAEPVTDGVVVTEYAEPGLACSDWWRAQGAFLWRHTTIRLAWTGYIPC